MKKVVRIGTVNTGRSWQSVFCKIEITDGKLSISGVIGPRSSGNCAGGCGQIDMEFAHRNPEDNDSRYDRLLKPSDFHFAPGWSASKWYDFLDVWKRWHLNDMKPDCEHQEALGWNKKKITLVHPHFNTWKIKDSDSQLRVEKLQEAFDSSRKLHKIVSVEDRVWLASRKRGALEFAKKTFLGRLASKVFLAAEKGEVYQPESEAEKSWFDGGVIEIKTETKNSGWVYESEHPDGVLGKPCPECGYAYGTACKKRELPQEAIDFLTNLPNADRQPAWV